MPRTEPVDLVAVLKDQQELRAQLIEKAATIGLTPEEAQQAATIESDWNTVLEKWTDHQEWAAHQDATE